MSNDNELFELCKKVYERTQWDNGRSRWVVVPIRAHGLDDYRSWKLVTPGYRGKTGLGFVPLYTSDYLLEKLPGAVHETLDKKDSKRKQQFALRCEAPIVNYMQGTWAFFYDAGYFTPESIKYWSDANTPLKALLKLVIALDDAGAKL